MPTDHSLQDPAPRTPGPLDWPPLPQTAPHLSTMPRFLFIAGTAGSPTSSKRESERCARMQQAAAELDGQVERLASPFGDGMIYTICQLPSNRAAASFATIMRGVYATGVRTVALPKQRRHVAYLTDDPGAPTQVPLPGRP
jgi:hypothetical protein